jgi:hypothetical protein
MWDDRKSLPPVVKLLTQIIAAYIAMMYGVRMAGLAIPGFGFVTFPCSCPKSSRSFGSWGS